MKLGEVLMADAVLIEIQTGAGRSKSCSKPATPGRSHRVADAAARFWQVTQPSAIKNTDSVTMCGVHFRLRVALKGEQAMNRWLPTSVVVKSLAGALQAIDHHVKRWHIRDFLLVLRIGCKVDRQAMRTTLRLDRPIAIHLIIAWRVTVLILLGRTVPALDADAFFTPMELRFLTGYTVKLPPPGALQEVILRVAVLGGYQYRTRDGPPGHEIMWLGLECLSIALLGLEVGDAE